IDSELAAEIKQSSDRPTSAAVAANLIPGVASTAGQPVSSVSAMVEALGVCQLLTAEQLDEVNRRLVPRFSDLRALGKELLQRGWLTAYQVNHLLQGRGQDLLLGPYLILERLGEGGAGQVFKARHRKLGRVAALKVIRKELVADAEVVSRFYREIQVVSQL